MIEWSNWQALVTFLLVQSIGLFAAAHAIVNKKDPKSSIAWTGLILLSPGVGALLYWWLGINRSRRKAKKIFKKTDQSSSSEYKCSLSPLRDLDFPDNIHRLERLTANVTQSPLYLKNKCVEPLLNGEGAYPEMLSAIRNAKEHIFLCTYIFENDEIGNEFAQALNEAGKRGVDVRVLVDDIGARYSFPSIFWKLKGENLKAAKFQRSFWPWRFHYAQLRNHRKVIVVDGEVAFVGGLNIRDRHLVKKSQKNKAVLDLHFKVTGEVLNELQETFLNDWSVATGDTVDGFRQHSFETSESFFPIRSISDGPDEDFDKLRWSILGAISSAEKSITIVNPYFLPDDTIGSALGVAAIKGVEVNIILPQKNNHRLVQWASMAMLPYILERGTKVFLTPEPFDHSKFFVVDGVWSLIGSTNWDPRSLRLNFELNLECYNRDLAEKLERLAQQKIKKALPLELEHLKNRNYFIKLRDGVARLFSPYL